MQAAVQSRYELVRPWEDKVIGGLVHEFTRKMCSVQNRDMLLEIVDSMEEKYTRQIQEIAGYSRARAIMIVQHARLQARDFVEKYHRPCEDGGMGVGSKGIELCLEVIREELEDTKEIQEILHKEESLEGYFLSMKDKPAALHH